MNKPKIPPMLLGPLTTSNQAPQVPSAFVPQPASVKVKQPLIPPTHLVQQAVATEYVDPYLFETGYYASQAEYEALSRPGATRLRLQADVENAKPKRRT